MYFPQEQFYVTLRCPESINQWLLDLGLPQYISDFLRQGWDDVRFITDLTPNDLTMHLKITNDEHQERILQSVKDMKQSQHLPSGSTTAS